MRVESAYSIFLPLRPSSNSLFLINDGPTQETYRWRNFQGKGQSNCQRYDLQTNQKINRSWKARLCHVPGAVCRQPTSTTIWRPAVSYAPRDRADEWTIAEIWSRIRVDDTRLRWHPSRKQRAKAAQPTVTCSSHHPSEQVHAGRGDADGAHLQISISSKSWSISGSWRPSFPSIWSLLLAPRLPAF